MRTTASSENVPFTFPGRDSDTIQNGFESSPCRRNRTWVRLGVKSTCASAFAIAWSLLNRIEDFWQVCETTNASTSTATITPTRSQVGPPAVSGWPQRPTLGRPTSVDSEGWTELVPDVREQHDHQDHDGTEERNRKHRVLEALLVGLEGEELDLLPAASVVHHRSSPA